MPWSAGSAADFAELASFAEVFFAPFALAFVFFAAVPVAFDFSTESAGSAADFFVGFSSAASSDPSSDPSDASSVDTPGARASDSSSALAIGPALPFRFATGRSASSARSGCARK